MALVPLNLFVTSDGRWRRQHVTCRYKCGDACSKSAPNKSDNPYFRDIARAVSRRSMLQATGVTVLTVGAGAAVAACSGEQSPTATTTSAAALPDTPDPGMNFTPVATNSEDAVIVPDGYQQQVIIRWGDPVVPDAPAWDVANQTGAAQRQQFGYNNDYTEFLAVPGQDGRHLMVVNHEYTTEIYMHPGYDEENPTREQFEVGIAAHGMTVMEVAEQGGPLVTVMGPYNRRITADTPMVLTGPAVGAASVRTEADPEGRTVAGTLNNCAGGLTPWGTVLSGEENFNQYFGAPADAPPPSPVVADQLDRYGIDFEPSDRRWEQFDSRFDLAATPNEANRFGYIVELNPWDPESTPVKHTALGRFKHEGATIHVTEDGTVVAYSGDDERFEYMYRFVSDKQIVPGDDAAAIAQNMTILDSGTLYVAQFSSDIPDAEIDGSGALPSAGRFAGTGTWVPLLATGDAGSESFVDGMTPEDVAVFTRFAADRAGATMMDRPEDFETNPVNGRVYVALTNNDDRGAEGEALADAPNPRNENNHGQVLEITTADHAGTDFTWELLLVCGDPAAADTYFGGFDETAVSPITCPDNVAFDSHGNLWISTDSTRAMDFNDGLYAVALEQPRRGETKLFLTVPIGAETCGPVIRDDWVVVAVQHPGEGDGHSIDDPLSHWPDGGDSPARPSVVSVWRTEGQIGV